MKTSDKMDFYALAAEFEWLYKSCLHKSDKKRWQKGYFLKVSLAYKADNEIFFQILDELKELKNYSKKRTNEEESYSNYFQKNSDGCYEYWYRHDIHPENYSEGDSNAFMVIGKENGKMKVLYVDRAGYRWKLRGLCKCLQSLKKVSSQKINEKNLKRKCLI